ncbi:MAG TPA: zinc-binding dehydrogenase, partial [Puia sp.]|nr:zinc-binding dehydrogenase [Puia sp.]
DGGMVDYLCVPSAALVHNDGLNYDELALIEPLAIGAHGLRRANLIPNEFVLVIGAGPIGLGTMEFARIAGGQVIAMDNNDDRLAFCKKNLNVEHIIYASKDNVAGKLIEITNGDMPTVVIDATGNQQAINKGLTYLAHGGKYILIGLQKNEIILSHPEFHRREATLMSSRNASRQDFEMVISCVKKKLIDPSVYITHREKFEKVADEFNSWLDPKNHVIKAMVEMD